MSKSPLTPLSQVPGKALLTFAWASLVANILIIGTGGAVRLTGSGLGCTDWPTCDGESIVTTPEMGIHGVIEFGNRTLTGLLLILALAVLVGTWKYRSQARDLWLLALGVLGGILLQAILGGITVLTQLNPFIVGLHYVASILLVILTALYLVKLRDWRNGLVREVEAPGVNVAVFVLLALFSAVTIAYGVLTTASGPHSGDDAAILRAGFDASLLAHFHAWPGYVTLGLAALFVVLTALRDKATLPAAIWLLVVLAVQIAVGVAQARNGLPPLLVGIHMVLAAVYTAIAATAWQRQRRTQVR